MILYIGGGHTADCAVLAFVPARIVRLPPASNLVKVNGLGTHERILPLTLLVTALWLMVFFRVRSAFSGVFVERVP